MSQEELTGLKTDSNTPEVDVRTTQEQKLGAFRAAMDVPESLNPTPEERKKVKFSSGYEKAAILLIALGVETGAKILKELRRDEIEQITRQIATLNNISAEQVEVVLEEFDDLVRKKKFQLTGGFKTAKDMLISAKGAQEADEFLRRHELGMAQDNFTLIRKTEAVKLAEYIRNEHPQIGALVVANLDNEQAADVLSHLSSDLACDVAIRITELGNISGEVIDELTGDLLEKIGTETTSFMEMEKGPTAVANILNAADTSTESKVLEGIEKVNLELAEEIRNQMFFFDDFVYLEDRTLQVVINACSKSELAMALKGSSDELMQKFTENMSSRASEILADDIENLGPITLSQVRDAQQGILKTMNQLQAEGKIVVVKDSDKLV